MKSTITLFVKQPHRDAASVRCAGGCGAPLPDIGPWRTRWGVLYVHRGCRCAAVWREDDVRMDEIPRRCACGISCRPRGSGQPLWDHAAVGPSDLLSVFVIRRPVSELPVRRTTKTASCLRSRLHGPKRVAERTRFELVVRNDPYVGLANRWFQPLTHLSGSHLAKLPPRGRTAKIRIFFELQGFRTKKDSPTAVLLHFALRPITRCSRRTRRPSWRGRGGRGW